MCSPPIARHVTSEYSSEIRYEPQFRGPSKARCTYVCTSRSRARLLEVSIHAFVCNPFENFEQTREGGVAGESGETGAFVRERARATCVCKRDSINLITGITKSVSRTVGSGVAGSSIHGSSSKRTFGYGRWNTWCKIRRLSTSGLHSRRVEGRRKLPVVTQQSLQSIQPPFTFYAPFVWVW